jgi:hypothetical protein
MKALIAALRSVHRFWRCDEGNIWVTVLAWQYRVVIPIRAHAQTQPTIRRHAGQSLIGDGVFTWATVLERTCQRSR